MCRQRHGRGDGYRRIDYFVGQQPVLQVGHREHNEDVTVDHHQRQEIAEAVMPEEEGGQCTSAQLHPEYAAGDSCPAVAAAPPEPEVADYGDVVLCREPVTAVFAVGGRGDDGLSPRQPVSDHVEEAAEAGADDEEQPRPEIVHPRIILYPPASGGMI